jgi:hypothetical protein
MESVEDRDKMLKKQKYLENNQRYGKVYINKDQYLESRINRNNLKLLFSSLGISGLFFENRNSDMNK